MGLGEECGLGCGLKTTKGTLVPFCQSLVRAVVERLDQLGIGSVADLEGVQEKVGFPLPKGLG